MRQTAASWLCFLAQGEQPAFLQQHTAREEVASEQERALLAFSALKIVLLTQDLTPSLTPMLFTCPLVLRALTLASWQPSVAGSQVAEPLQQVSSHDSPKEARIQP
eukprot:m.130687 g.130687  ORF g.130687 m.130687 type:complete len:106 (-) comp52356_c0_seq2:1072-1389(-)